MNKIIRILIGVVLVVIALAFAKNLIAQGVVESAVKLVTGLSLKMKKLDVNILNTYVSIKDMRLHNPKGFQDKIMVDLPEIHVDYEFGTLLKGKVHLQDVRLDLKEFVVVKNEKGEVNINSLTALQAGKKEAEADKAQEKSKPAPAPEIQIDNLSLKIGKVIYKDYSSGSGTPSVKEFPIGVNETYKNITNPNYLVSLIVLKIMMNSPIAALTGIDMSAIQGQLGDVLGSAQQMATDAAVKAQAMIGDQAAQAKELLGTAPDSLKQTAGDLSGKLSGGTESLKETAGVLKEKLKLPFGKSE